MLPTWHLINLKAILRDLTTYEKFYFMFFHNKIMKWLCLSPYFKAILRDVMGDEKCCFSLSFIIHLGNDPCCYRILSLSVFVLSTLHKMEYCTQYILPFNTTHCKLYRDPSKGKKLQTVSQLLTFPIAFIFTTYCLFYRFM